MNTKLRRKETTYRVGEYIYLAVCFLNQYNKFLAWDKKGPCFKVTYILVEGRGLNQGLDECILNVTRGLRKDPSLRVPQSGPFLVALWSYVPLAGNSNIH